MPPYPQQQHNNQRRHSQQQSEEEPLKAPSRTVYFGALDGRVTERLMYELAVQAGPALAVRVHHDYVRDAGSSDRSRSFAFVEFARLSSAVYCVALYRGLLRLFGGLVRVNYSSSRAPAHELVTPEDTALLERCHAVLAAAAAADATAAAAAAAVGDSGGAAPRRPPECRPRA